MSTEEVIKRIEEFLDLMKGTKTELTYGESFRLAIEALELKMALEDGGEIMPPCR